MLLIIVQLLQQLGSTRGRGSNFRNVDKGGFSSIIDIIFVLAVQWSKFLVKDKISFQIHKKAGGIHVIILASLE